MGPKRDFECPFRSLGPKRDGTETGRIRQKPAVNMAEAGDSKLVGEESKENASSLVESQDSTLQGGNDQNKSGSRLKHLRNAIENTVQRCVKATRLSLLMKAFPEQAKENPRVFKYIKEEMQQQLLTCIKAEIDTMFEEEGIDELVEQLDKLAKEAEEKQKLTAWRPSGEPATDLRSHLSVVRQKQQEKLQEMLQEHEDEGRMLETKVLAGRKQLAELQQQMRDKSELLTQACEAVSSEDLQELNQFLHMVKSTDDLP